jgi:hypothetical protein
MEGGGSGNVFTDNYCDDLYDASSVGSTDTFINNIRGTHGAHPYMNLWEGNEGCPFHADFVHGSSSHNVLFRNWFWGDSTGNRFNWAADGAANLLWGYVGMQLDYDQHYWSALGNVLGMPSGSLSGPYHATWNTATVYPSTCPGGYTASTAAAYVIGCDVNGATSQNPGGVPDATAQSSVILHGNYDYKTMGVAYWVSSNHTLQTSMYYSTRPSFLTGYSWPLVGPDVGSIVNHNPAYNRYNQITVSTSSGTAIKGPVVTAGSIIIH